MTPRTELSSLSLAALAGLALFAAPANATIIEPTTATVAVGGSTNTVITSTIDGSGLSGVGDILTQTHDFGGGQWISGNGTSPNVEVVFDLNGTFDVDSVHLWNFHWSNNVTHWGTQTLDISFSTDGGSNYSNTVQDLAFTRAVTGDPIPAQTQTFAAVSGVTHIKVSDMTYFEAGPYVGFAEIRFGGTGATPVDPVLSQDLVNGDPDLDFGTVVGSAPFSESRTVRFVNDGPTNTIEITTATVSGDAAYSLSDIAINGSGGISLPQSLAVGDYIEFTVAASLAAPASGVTGNLVIDTDAVDQDQNLPITGTFTALTDPVLSQDLVNGDPDLDFGTVVGSAPYSESRTVRFENDGPSNAIEITTATVSGDAAYSLGDIAVNGSGGVSLPQSLAVGDYIEFTVAASLAAPASGVTGNLVIDTDASGQDQNLPITGTFTEPTAIITPVAVSSPTPALYPATTGLIDGVGLSGGGSSGDILSETHDYGSSANSWHSDNGNGPDSEITFDLGGTATVDSIHLWNWSATNGVVNRSVKTVDISFSTNGGATYGNLIDNLGDFSLPASTTTATVDPAVVPVSTLSFPAAVTGVTHIRLTDFQNFGDAYTAISEIRFGGSGVAPNDPILGQDLVNGDPDLNFGLVTGGGPFSESRTVRFVNEGPTNAIEMTTATVSGDPAYSLTDIAVNGSGGVSLPQTLAVGGYIEFTVAVSLATPDGGVTGNLVIDTDAPDQDQDLLISGTYGTTPTPPPVTNEAPAPGKRVRVTTPGSGYAGNPSVFHTLYLPPEWVPGEKYPVIIEYGGNGWTVEANKLGYYQSAGTGYIWVSMPNIDQNSTLGDKSDDFNTTSWWGSEGMNDIGAADDAAYAMATVIDLIENYGGDHSCVFVTGFSRGAVACGWLGRLDDAMADIWVGFIPHSHHDAWFDTGTRTDRVKGRASFITYGEDDGGGGNSRAGVNMLNARGFPVESYELAGTVHTDEWITDASAPLASSLSYTGHPLVSDVRARMRTWMSEVVASKPGTSSISGVVTDASGAPIAGVRVQSGSTHWTFTDATGAYELAALIDGARTVTVSHASHLWSPDTLNATLAGADLTAQNFQATTAFPFAITGMSWDVDDDLIIDFTGPPNGTFEVRKSLDLQVWPFPTTVTAQNAPVTTDASGVGQAIIDAADAAEARGFFQMAHPAP